MLGTSLGSLECCQTGFSQNRLSTQLAASALRTGGRHTQWRPLQLVGWQVLSTQQGGPLSKRLQNSLAWLRLAKRTWSVRQQPVQLVGWLSCVQQQAA